jgi:chromosome condensin MukBEF MukE localization factor
LDFRTASAVLVVATLALGASTGYLLVSPTRVATSTLFTTQTVTFSSGVASPYS